jgi:hypothetical protein
MLVKVYRVLKRALGNVTGGSFRFGTLAGALLTDVQSEKSDRPLDCWKEVELFKSEVAKVEQVCLSDETSKAELII